MVSKLFGAGVAAEDGFDLSRGPLLSSLDAVVSTSASAFSEAAFAFFDLLLDLAMFNYMKQ